MKLQYCYQNLYLLESSYSKRELKMPPDKICKTVHQYNKEPISTDDMKKLKEIAENCKSVKNYVYSRFGGIKSLTKIYPGYTVQNEMTNSGLRSELGLPSVYFYLAIFDAVADIKCQWTQIKNKILNLINKNDKFSEEEKHYLRFLIKVNNVFVAVLNQYEVKLPKEIQKTYDQLAIQVNIKKLHRYLCRQVRKYHIKLHTDIGDGFSLSEKAYRYEDHGIYIAAKEKRKRIFIPLTDNNRYKRQIYIKLYPECQSIEIKVPIDIVVKYHDDYTNYVGVAMGIYTMLTTHKGNCYGEELGKYQIEYANWIRIQTKSYNKNRNSNSGRKKYNNKKRQLTEQMHSYINHELNRFFQDEKPRIVYIVKLPKSKVNGFNRRINNSIAMWQRGYIRERLEQKCKEQSVELIQVLGKDISNDCSCCGSIGKHKMGKFICEVCGFNIEEKINTARNILKRGLEGKILN